MFVDKLVLKPSGFGTNNVYRQLIILILFIIYTLPGTKMEVVNGPLEDYIG